MERFILDNLNTIVHAGSFILVCLLIVRLFRKKSAQNAARKIMDKKRNARDNIVHNCLAHDSKETKPITDATELLQDFKKGRRKCADVMLHHCKKSADIGRRVLHSVTEEFYDEALEAAQAVDAGGFHGGVEGKLRGIPLSIKDNFVMRGSDCTLGIASRCFKPANADGLLVRLLRNAGGIPFVKSNIPQLLMMPESENGIWGTACNPWDLSRTPGGSSGGEGALIAAGCSVLGLGSDIGGSIRIPAHYCGICGFKASSLRVSKMGSSNNRYQQRNGQMVIQTSAGPMARSVRDLSLMMEVLAGPEASRLDMYSPPVPWRPELVLHGIKDAEGKKKKLRVGLMVSDGNCEPVPAVQRAVREAAEALRMSGVEVVEFKNPLNGVKLLQTYVSLTAADGNWYSFMRALEGEELHGSYKTLQSYTDLPNWLRPPLLVLLKSVLGEHRKAEMFSFTKDGGLSVREYWELIADVRAIEQTYADAFAEQGLDGLLYPVLPFAALPHGMSADMICCLTYTFLANLLHWPAGVVPVTLVREDEQTYDIASLPPRQRDSIAKLMSKATEGSAGLPVGVQIMTPMWQDELCLHLMGLLEAKVGFKHAPTFKK